MPLTTTLKAKGSERIKSLLKKNFSLASNSPTHVSQVQPGEQRPHGVAGVGAAVWWRVTEQGFITGIGMCTVVEEQGGGAKVWKRGAGGSAVTKQSIREGRHVWPPKGLHGEAGEKPLCN